ncbi:MAG: NAD(P)/FAD-dependent oxidoreductase [Thermoguttaceae bacterium]
MNRRVDVLVIGAGPAGMASGIAAASCCKKTVILEQNRSPGKKLLIAGSGQCNLTHTGEIEAFASRFGGPSKKRFVVPALHEWSGEDTKNFFEKRGVPLLERDDGKIFPASMQSADILRVLTDELNLSGVSLFCNTIVKSIVYQSQEKTFYVTTQTEKYKASILIVATGGLAAPATGSNGDGIRFAESLGHRIVSPMPALTPVITVNFPFAESAGIAFSNVLVRIMRNEKEIASQKGALLLTHRGLSGPVILDSSRWMLPGDLLHISFIEQKIDWSALLTGKKTLKNAIIPLGLPERFLKQLLGHIGFDESRSASEITREERNRLETAFTSFPFQVKQLGSWSEAMCTAGGVSLDQVNRKTMESRLQSGLFFCGEVLDIDGDTGGYNIQFALSSGFLAGRSAAKTFKSCSH